jgi:hypothetical protein
MKLGMYIMAPEPISTAYFTNPSHQSVCLHMYPYYCWQSYGSVKCILPFIARQRLGKHVPSSTNTRNNRIIVGRVWLWVCLCTPLSLLCNNWVKTFSRQRRIVGGVVFYAISSSQNFLFLLLLLENHSSEHTELLAFDRA